MSSEIYEDKILRFLADGKLKSIKHIALLIDLNWYDTRDVLQLMYIEDKTVINEHGKWRITRKGKNKISETVRIKLSNIGILPLLTRKNIIEMVNDSIHEPCKVLMDNGFIIRYNTAYKRTEKFNELLADGEKEIKVYNAIRRENK